MLIVLLLVCVLSTVIAFAVIRHTRIISSSGTINVPASPPGPPPASPTYELTVYEQGTTTPCSSIDWGTLNRGEVATHSVTIKNTGTGNFASLKMTYSMSPESVGTISWDVEGTPLAAGESLDAMITLRVATNAPEGVFNCEIYINGET